MTFKEYLNKSWNDHVDHSEKVATTFTHGLSLIENTEQISDLARLIFHVMGEHLGQWQEGDEWLQKLLASKYYVADHECKKVIDRLRVAFTLASDQDIHSETKSSEKLQQKLHDLSTSDQVIACAVTSSALASQKNYDRAQFLFDRAVELAQMGLKKEDPANRSLGVTGYNLACILEEKPERNKKEVAFMIHAAEISRKYWEVAGGWKEAQIGEYRLAMSYLKANELVKSYNHAQLAVEIGKDNKAVAEDMFYSYEAMAIVENARENSIGFNEAFELASNCFASLKPEQQSHYEKDFAKLKSLS